jgi:hypothetical protein
MKTSPLILMLILAVVFVIGLKTHASETTFFACTQTSEPNGLGVEKLSLEISNEDPEADMTLNYIQSSQNIYSHMAYEGDYSHYKLIPNSSGDGNLSVNLINNHGVWKATVTSESIDTFSVLTCRKK